MKCERLALLVRGLVVGFLCWVGSACSADAKGSAAAAAATSALGGSSARAAAGAGSGMPAGSSRAPAAASGKPGSSLTALTLAPSSAASAVRPRSESCRVEALPDAVRQAYKLTDFYQKYADAGGVPIVTSRRPVDRTLVLACQLVNEMLGERSDVRDALIRNKAHFTIIAIDERTTDTPEYTNLPAFYDTRARGLGGKVASCAEESILCDRKRDRWRGESICVHEFSHTIAMYGLYGADPTFQTRLHETWQAAMEAGLFRDTYATENAQEYWAEGVQSWYDTNLQASPANGVHNEVNTRRELQAYDPKLYALIDELLPEQVRWEDCYRSTELE